MNTKLKILGTLLQKEKVEGKISFVEYSSGFIFKKKHYEIEFLAFMLDFGISRALYNNEGFKYRSELF